MDKPLFEASEMFKMSQMSPDSYKMHMYMYNILHMVASECIYRTCTLHPCFVIVH